MKKRLLSLMLALALCLSLAVPALAAGSTFSDVAESHWASSYVERAFQEGAINGTAYNESTGERRFSPNENLTMAQFVTILCRKYYAGELDASTASGTWYAAAQETAEHHGLLSRVSSGAGMTKNISRSDMAAVLFSLMEDQGVSLSGEELQGVASKIPDLDQSGVPEAVEAVVFLGIINGVDGKGNFDGKSFMTRAQAAAVYCRAVDVLAQQPDQSPETAQPESVKPETAKPDTAKPETTKPETKPETSDPAPSTAAPVEERSERMSVGDVIRLDLDASSGVSVRAESSNPSVAAIQADSSVKAVSAGTADITFTITFSGASQVMVCHLTVDGAQSPVQQPQTPPSSSNPGQDNSQGSLLANGKEITDDNIREIIYGLKSQYPEGMHWTNDNDYLSQAMRTHGYGCEGFALICSDAAFGSLPLSRTHSDFDSVRVGDLLRVNNDTHTVIVLEKKADSVVVAEGNYNSSIHWGREISRSELASGNFTVRTRYPA